MKRKCHNSCICLLWEKTCLLKVPVSDFIGKQVYLLAVYAHTRCMLDLKCQVTLLNTYIKQGYQNTSSNRLLCENKYYTTPWKINKPMPVKVNNVLPNMPLGT
jgi:hypothetical protein